MKRIEDAPKELQAMFADVWERVVYSASGISDYRDEVEHAFLKGFDTAMATGGLPQRPKRTIQTIVNIHGELANLTVYLNRAAAKKALHNIEKQSDSDMLDISVGGLRLLEMEVEE